MFGKDINSWHSLRGPYQKHVKHFDDLRKVMLKYMSEDEFLFRCNMILNIINMKRRVNVYNADYPGIIPEFVCFLKLPRNINELLENVENSKNPNYDNNVKIIKFLKNLSKINFIGY